MLDFELEKEIIEHGFTAVCGVDEAGRGPLAGRVYAAAVILPVGLYIAGLKDSKKVGKTRRKLLEQIIKREAIAWNIDFAEVEDIDNLNILNAAQYAMRKAVNGLFPKSDFALIDGNIAREFTLAHQTVVKGDEKSVSIAAASILAKTARDDYMRDMHELYPQYNFVQNKGYPTPEHIFLLRRFGPCEIHRERFMRNFF